MELPFKIVFANSSIHHFQGQRLPQPHIDKPPSSSPTLLSIALGSHLLKEWKVPDFKVSDTLQVVSVFPQQAFPAVLPLPLFLCYRMICPSQVCYGTLGYLVRFYYLINYQHKDYWHLWTVRTKKGRRFGWGAQEWLWNVGHGRCRAQREQSRLHGPGLSVWWILRRCS